MQVGGLWSWVVDGLQLVANPTPLAPKLVPRQSRSENEKDIGLKTTKVAAWCHSGNAKSMADVK